LHDSQDALDNLKSVLLESRPKTDPVAVCYKQQIRFYDKELQDVTEVAGQVVEYFDQEYNPEKTYEDCYFSSDGGSQGEDEDSDDGDSDETPVVREST
jgi:hypothetical protein